MTNPFETGPERIPTKEEVMKIMDRLAENSVLLRELSDEKGLYQYEVKAPGPKPGETIEFEYTRKGRHPNKIEAKTTTIFAAFYKDGNLISGNSVAEYDPETGVWNIATYNPEIKRWEEKGDTFST